MGGTSTTQQSSQQQSQLEPYKPAAGGLQNLLGALDGTTPSLGVTPQITHALDQIQANASGLNPFAAPGQAAVLSQLNGGANYGPATGMVKNGYGTAADALSPYLSGSAFDPSSNPALGAELSAVGTQVQNAVNPMFAAAGRLGSPANYQAVAQGIAQGDAPILQNAASNQLAAASALGGLANSAGGILGNLDAGNAGILTSALGNAPNAFQLANLGPQTQLAAALQQAQLPIQNAATLAGILSPIAAQFGTQNSNGQQQGSSTMSGAQQFATIAGGLASLFSPLRTKTPS
jgi:hypothetical protein